ncbi:MAG TPA: regulatory protein RecX [Dehalococcoidia bacterium]|nr:regulatory protein RecX [Dehalococcoidia bacterium]
MPAITALLPPPHRRGVVDLFLDGTLAFTLHRSVAQEARLFIGRELSQDDILALRDQEAFQSGLDAAYRFLAYRPRSESEVRTRLRRRKFEAGLIDRVVAKLKEQRFLDDVAFAQQWTENRATHSPRSRAMVRSELRLKGVAPEIAQTAVEDLDDAEAAYEAGGRRSLRIKAADYQEFRKRLWDFLRRRGFSYDVTSRVVERLWREREGNSPSETDSLDTSGG